jgi:hypothetical protein
MPSNADSLTKPVTGSHPGATVFTAALAVGQDRKVTGGDLLTALVAGSEVMVRIGHTTKHSNEVARLPRARHYRPVRRGGSRGSPDGPTPTSIAIAGNARMAKTNNIPAPPDLMLAEYSIPFSVALSLYRKSARPVMVRRRRGARPRHSRPRIAHQDGRDIGSRSPQPRRQALAAAGTARRIPMFSSREGTAGERERLLVAPM